jgi:hypothetical protein
MLSFLLSTVSGQRKLRLFAVACCYRVGSLLTGDDHSGLVTIERFADGLASPVELAEVFSREINPAVTAALTDAALSAATCARLRGDAAGDRSHPMGQGDCLAAEIGEGKEQCRLLREIFGNPFRPVVVDPRWLTSTVLGVARGIDDPHEDRAFDRLPILADALEDAGCDDADILTHCRGDGPHVRGCWVVDLILGKA